MTTDEKVIQEQIDKIQADIDMLVAQYDARILSSCLLGRAASLLNGLRQLGITNELTLCQMLEEVVAVIMDDSKAKPIVQHHTADNGQLN